MGFIERLEQCLEKQGMSQRKLSEIIGLRRSTISDWKKNGNLPDVEQAYKMAKVLKVSLEWLITGQSTATITLTTDQQKHLSLYMELTDYQKEICNKMLEVVLNSRTDFANLYVAEPSPRYDV